MQRGREKGVGDKETRRRRFLIPLSPLPLVSLSHLPYSLSDYEIRLVALKPRPKADKPVQTNEYKTTLIITKK
jgi:hypothetical protein